MGFINCRVTDRSHETQWPALALVVPPSQESALEDYIEVQDASV